jgi:hypothetical protein
MSWTVQARCTRAESRSQALCRLWVKCTKLSALGASKVSGWKSAFWDDPRIQGADGRGRPFRIS